MDIRKYVGPCPYCAGKGKAILRKTEDGEEYVVRKEAAIEAAKLLYAFCKVQHWTCIQCPFYEKTSGHCLLHGFPHRWNENDWKTERKDWDHA